MCAAVAQPKRTKYNFFSAMFRRLTTNVSTGCVRCCWRGFRRACGSVSGANRRSSEAFFAIFRIRIVTNFLVADRCTSKAVEALDSRPLGGVASCCACVALLRASIDVSRPRCVAPAFDCCQTRLFACVCHRRCAVFSFALRCRLTLLSRRIDAAVTVLADDAASEPASLRSGARRADR